MLHAGITLSVPYYAGFSLLERTLRSIHEQANQSCSVLICDDSPAGLSEAELTCVRAIFAGRFPLRIIRNETNLGMARSWTRCLDEADTDLVTIVHGDDELDSSYAAAMVALAHRYPQASALFCGAKVISDEGRPVFSLPDFYKHFVTPRHGEVLELSGESAVSSLLRGNYIFCPTLCYRRSLLGSARFDARYRMVPDLDLVTRLLFDGKSIVGTPKRRLYRYRRHGGNTTQLLTRELTRFTEECAFYDEIGARSAAQGYAAAERVAKQRGIIKKNLLFCIARDAAQRDLRGCLRKAKLYHELFHAGVTRA